MKTNDTTYTAKQNIANALTKLAACNRNENSMFDIAFEKIGRFICAVKDQGGFAAQIAETVERSMNPFGYMVAKISSKQAWCLACAAVENGIEF